MHSHRLGISLLLAAGLAACNSDNGPDYASSIDPSDMGNAAEVSEGYVQDAVNSVLGFQPGTELPELPLAPASAGMTAVDRLVQGIRDKALIRAGHPEMVGTGTPLHVSQVCTIQVSGTDTLGNPIDSDDDGIADDLQIIFPSGCTFTDAGSTTTYGGSLHLQDVAGLFGFQLDISHFKYVYTNTTTGDYQSIGVNGSEHSLYTSTSATHGANLSYSTAVLGTPFGGTARPMLVAPPDFSANFNWNESTSFDPESDIVFGDPSPSGALDVNLDFRAQVTDTTTRFFHFGLTTPTVLHYDADVCGDIDSGQIRGALNNSDSIYFTITWTGCGTTTFETHGTTGGASVVAARK